jgi:hypothetical protein
LRDGKVKIKAKLIRSVSDLTFKIDKFIEKAEEAQNGMIEI